MHDYDYDAIRCDLQKAVEDLRCADESDAARLIGEIAKYQVSCESKAVRSRCTGAIENLVKVFGQSYTWRQDSFKAALGFWKDIPSLRDWIAEHGEQED